MISSEEFIGDYCELRMVVESERAVQKSFRELHRNPHAVEANMSSDTISSRERVGWANADSSHSKQRKGPRCDVQ